MDLTAAGLEAGASHGESGSRVALGAQAVARGHGPVAHPGTRPTATPSRRTQLVGPPRRVRWVAGPPQEISNMVTAGGRSFFAGVLARDAFNGLRLWEQTLRSLAGPRRIQLPIRAGQRAARSPTAKLLLVRDRQAAARPSTRRPAGSSASIPRPARPPESSWRPD